MKNPKIRFKGYTDDWEQHKLIDISEIVTGTTPPTRDKNNYGGRKLFVSPADIQSNRYVDNTITKLTEKGFGLGRKLRPGTSLFVSIGSIGKVAQIKDFATTNQQINAIIPFGFMDDDYVFSMLEKEADKIKNMSAQQVIPIINKTTFGNIEIMYPLKNEQIKIGKFFRILDHLITLHQRKCEEIKTIKKYMLQKMFPQNGMNIPEIRFNGFTDAWKWHKVTDLLKNKSSAMKIGPFGSALKKEFFVEKGIKVYAQENVFTGDFSIGEYYITEQKYHGLQSCELFPGDLVISMMGTIGACAIFPDTAERGIMNSHLLRLQFVDEVLPKYIMFLLRDSEIIRLQIDKLSVGSIMSGLSSSVVKKLNFPVPKIGEQKKIVKYLESLDRLITLHQQKCNELQSIKKFMLQNMFV